MSNFLRAVANRLQPLRVGPAKIDVKQLIAKLGDDELLQAADAYFAGLGVDSEQCHKPFSNVADAIHITRNLSLLLQAADVFSGADVLDFGCATGWLSLALADLGCSVTGVDIAPAALRLADAWCAQRGVRVGGAVQFKVYDGHRLPLDDSSVDRVVCFDAFHHVKDQAATLKELARVLRPGGRIAMVEPGPFHSQTDKSQAEMAQYKVIENDIVMTDIAAAALAAGLAAPQMLVQLHQPMVVPFDHYQQWSGPAGLPKGDGSRLLTSLHRHLMDTQCFYLSKPGASAGVDSRRAEALAAEVQLVAAHTVAGVAGLFELQFRIRNTGEAVWINQRGARGHVNLGCQLLRPDESVDNLDYQRFAVSNSPVEPGATVALSVRLQSPGGGLYKFRFDLVAENTSWFAQAGRCKPLVWSTEQ
ncbi:class I SAM-dependent methyltransferase [Rhodoferax sp.]|uniref:class I SAM-dependent methyltransferase n=1 Tax=Rhodoferax sp. TaxID=50421 RepID=UPI0027738F3A|nr:methyltransferase domain-containing protein [Rhodoferax sp.]